MRERAFRLIDSAEQVPSAFPFLDWAHRHYPLVRYRNWIIIEWSEISLSSIKVHLCGAIEARPIPHLVVSKAKRIFRPFNVEWKCKLNWWPVARNPSPIYWIHTRNVHCAVGAWYCGFHGRSCSIMADSKFCLFCGSTGRVNARTYSYGPDPFTHATEQAIPHTPCTVFAAPKSDASFNWNLCLRFGARAIRNRFGKSIWTWLRLAHGQKQSHKKSIKCRADRSRVMDFHVMFPGWYVNDFNGPWNCTIWMDLSMCDRKCHLCCHPSGHDVRKQTLTPVPPLLSGITSRSAHAQCMCKFKRITVSAWTSGKCALIYSFTSTWPANGQ